MFLSQLRELLHLNAEPDRHKELRDIIKEFRDDELGHLNIGLEHDAEQVLVKYFPSTYMCTSFPHSSFLTTTWSQAPMYEGLRSVVETGCRAAIWVAQRF